ncbi:HD domain-containing protein, partial [Patescibacteria group bacterium]|nr:HD domain-containing protein [Patescibacteria group bacterium]
MNASDLLKIESYCKRFDGEKLNQAFSFIEQKKQEDPFAYGLALSVVNFLLPLRPDEDTIIAAFLHSYFLSGELDENFVKEKYGSDVFNILAGVKRLNNTMNYRENDKASQLEALRKMFLTMAKDIRVVLIVLACRLYRLEQIKDFVEESERESFAKETFDVYVPIA